MSAIFFRFIEIALFRKGPQDLPASGFLLGLALALNSLVIILSVVMFHTGDIARSAAQSLVGVISEFMLVWVVLVVFNLRQRFVQTMTAVLGVDAVIGMSFIPLLASMPAAPGEGQASGLQALMLLALLVWGVMALGWILRHALSSSALTGLAISLSYHIAMYGLLAKAL